MTATFSSRGVISGRVRVGIVNLIRRKSFQFTDGNRLILFGPSADFFARMGTNSAQHSRKRQVLIYKLDCFLVFALGDELHISLDVDVRRARHHAGSAVIPFRSRRSGEWSEGKADMLRLACSISHRTHSAHEPGRRWRSLRRPCIGPFGYGGISAGF